MNVLIIDDQISVLKGILSGVNFERLGIDHAFSATSVAKAKEIIKANTVDIMLSDIEMPGENGLSLIKWVSENYPSIVRIFLTSHASFQYAQESIKLGCFDYIIQPAPYHEIEDVLLRAIAKITSDKQKADYYRFEVLSNIVLNLFSSNPSNKRQSITSLNQIGYNIKEDSEVQVLIVDIYQYAKSDSVIFSDVSVFPHLLQSTNNSVLIPDVHSLICLNRYKQFVILLYSNSNTLSLVTKDIYETVYEKICAELGNDISCYVSPPGHVSHLRDTIFPTHTTLINNVAKNPGLYYADEERVTPEVASLSESIAKWTRLLDNNQFQSLEDSIFSFLDLNASLNKFNLENLCEFHQALTKMLFVFSHKQNIDIMNLFTDSYNYNDYMSSFKDIESLKTGISYIIKAITDASDEESSKDNIQRAIDFILANISSDISVKDVAGYVHFSPEYFSKLFKKEMGENVKNYMLRIKVDAAKDLLENPNIPVSMVASELGYSNFSHFTQMFKKHENMTPTEYRKLVLQRISEKETDSE